MHAHNALPLSALGRREIWENCPAACGSLQNCDELHLSGPASGAHATRTIVDAGPRSTLRRYISIYIIDFAGNKLWTCLENEGASPFSSTSSSSSSWSAGQNSAEAKNLNIVLCLLLNDRLSTFQNPPGFQLCRIFLGLLVRGWVTFSVYITFVSNQAPAGLSHFQS